ncbi:MAG TPA: ATPase domain-containing protein [Kofleriaceae bacterium]|nr:ATPase domain-containing protein [Kofleriaceae bacterium]
MTDRLRTGVEGLDDILDGGFPRNRMYLVQGDPGVGKTTLALQILRDGVRCGERCLYVNLSETVEELAAVATSHGWSLDGIDVFPMTGSLADPIAADDDNTLYAPSDVELGERTEELLRRVDEIRPRRIIVDSCSELRLLAQTQLRFRRLLLALKTDLNQRGSTVFLLENPTQPGGDPLLQSLVHGVITIEQLSPIYGAERRRLRVMKLREVSFRGGYHDAKIMHEGVIVFPRLVAAEHHTDFVREMVSSDIGEVDVLLGGGLQRGTGTLLLGPAGSGKSALASQYACASAARGECAAIFTFDEGTGTLFERARGLGMPVAEHVEAGRIIVQQIDPAEMTPGEFAALVRRAVDVGGAKLVVIDSLNGYLNAMPEENFLIAQLHELLTYLRQQGIVLIMVVAQHGLLGSMVSPIDVSYLADNIVLFRFFESEGRVRKAISVVKKRAGKHEDTIRELSLSAAGIRVGEPLAAFRGVLTGVPQALGGTGTGAGSSE